MKKEEDKRICNFVPHAIELLDVYIDTGEDSIPYIRFFLEFEDGYKSEIYILPLAEIEKIDWLNLDIRCRFEPSISRTHVTRHLCDEMRAELGQVPRNTIYQLSRVGMSAIRGKCVFCTGREVIRPSSFISDIRIEKHVMKHYLDIDTGLSENEAAAHIIDFVSLAPNPGRIMLAYKLGYLMRQAYVDAGMIPKSCIYLYGHTGTKKTTFSSFLNQLYDRSKGIKSPPRLDTSIAAAAQILQKYPNDVVIFDDLCPKGSNQIRRQQEETLIEIMRYIGDGVIPARIWGKNLSEEVPRCGVIFTGEYVIGKGSDAARFLAVEMTPPDGRRLEKFQSCPLDISTFFYFYITWFVEYYQEIVVLLREWLHNYRQVNLRVHDRLQDTHFFLNSSYSIFLQYFGEKKFIPKKDVIHLHKSFYELLTLLVQKQNERVQEQIAEKVKTENYLEEIRVLYRNNEMSLVYTPSDFDKRQHDGIIYNERLYLRREKLSSFFPLVDIEEIVDDLEKQGVLETGKHSRTKQLSLLKGMRFYVILLMFL